MASIPHLQPQLFFFSAIGFVRLHDDMLQALIKDGQGDKGTLTIAALCNAGVAGLDGVRVGEKREFGQCSARKFTKWHYGTYFRNADHAEWF